MRRLFWISVGVGITIVVVRKVNQANQFASHFTPAGVSTAVGNVSESLRSFGQNFKESMAEHEERLTQALLGETEEESSQ